MVEISNKLTVASEPIFNRMINFDHMNLNTIISVQDTFALLAKKSF